jgi:hypothetical protein
MPGPHETTITSQQGLPPAPDLLNMIIVQPKSPLGRIFLKSQWFSHICENLRVATNLGKLKTGIF